MHNFIQWLTSAQVLSPGAVEHNLRLRFFLTALQLPDVQSWLFENFGINQDQLDEVFDSRITDWDDELAYLLNVAHVEGREEDILRRLNNQLAIYNHLDHHTTHLPLGNGG